MRCRYDQVHSRKFFTFRDLWLEGEQPEFTKLPNGTVSFWQAADPQMDHTLHGDLCSLCVWLAAVASCRLGNSALACVECSHSKPSNSHFP